MILSVKFTQASANRDICPTAYKTFNWCECFCIQMTSSSKFGALMLPEIEQMSS